MAMVETVDVPTETRDCEHVQTLTDKINELIEVTNKQNDMLSLISEQVKPVLDSMQNSPIGALLGMAK